MDLNGIICVSDIYQKFEAFCMEVEETISQEVQTLGASVKNFYSDVMQDLVVPPVTDPVEIGTSDEQVGDTKIMEKPKVSNAEEVIKVDNNKKADDTNLGIEENPNTVDCNPSQISDSITPMAKDLTRSSSLFELPDERPEAVCEQMDVIPCPDSDQNLGCECDSKEEEWRSGKSIAASGISIKLPSFDSKSSSYSGHMPTESNVMSPRNSVVSVTEHSAEDMQLSESANMKDSKCHFDSGSPDVRDTNPFEINDVNEQGMEPIELIIERQLKETCVLVDSDKLCSSPRSECKQKPIKKKIWDAFSSKMRSTRKHEYEQLAMHHGDIVADSNLGSTKDLMRTLTINSETKALQNQDLYESEWELL